MYKHLKDSVVNEPYCFENGTEFVEKSPEDSVLNEPYRFENGTEFIEEDS